MSSLKTCFNGCSFTAGIGFSPEDRQCYSYDRLLLKELNFLSDNIAKEGSSNYTIFMRSANAIQEKKYDIIFTQWSSLNRLWLYPGPDTYFYINDVKSSDFKYRNIYLSSKEKNKFRDTALILNHDYQNIIELVDYTKILNELARLNSVKLVNINGLVPWQDDLINAVTSSNLNNRLSEYTRDILDFDNRADDEIILYFSKLQTKFLELDQSNWVNLFNSFYSNMTDVGIDGHHPGVNSHQWMANQVSNFLTTNQIL